MPIFRSVNDKLMSKLFKTEKQSKAQPSTLVGNVLSLACLNQLRTSICKVKFATFSKKLVPK